MQHVTLAQRLGISTFAAHEMLNQHRGLFNQYWAWSEDWVAHALDTGVMRTPMGWTCRTGITEFNARSIANWPIQATSADIMRARLHPDGPAPGLDCAAACTMHW